MIDDILRCLFQGGMYIFQLLDWYAAAWTLLVVCFLEVVVFSWVYGKHTQTEYRYLIS